jgi:hypothetical protein
MAAKTVTVTPMRRTLVPAVFLNPLPVEEAEGDGPAVEVLRVTAGSVAEAWTATGLITLAGKAETVDPSGP